MENMIQHKSINTYREILTIPLPSQNIKALLEEIARYYSNKWSVDQSFLHKQLLARYNRFCGPFTGFIDSKRGRLLVLVENIEMTFEIRFVFESRAQGIRPVFLNLNYQISEN
jgi:hypothetical protein